MKVVSFRQTVIWCYYLEDTRLAVNKIALKVYYKSTFALIPNGIAFNSDFKHINSPATHVMAAHAIFNAHHENVAGKLPL